MKKIAVITLLVIVLIGCSGKFEEAIEKGDSLFDESKFEEALLEYEIALEEKQDEEVKERVNHIHIYLEVEALVADDEWMEANDFVAKVKEDGIDEPLKEAITEQKEVIIATIDKRAELEDQLANIEELMEDEELDEAEKLLRSLQEDEEAKHLKKEHKELEDEMKKVAANIKKREKVAAEKKAKEEAKQKAQVKQEFLAKFAEYDQFAENELLVHDYDSEAAYRQAIEIGADQWDSYMNEVYQTLKEDLSASDFASLKKEQQDWLDKLEAEMFDDAYSLENAGTAGKDAVLWIYYDQTRERCFHLVNEYLE